jgi:HEAT repeat protein
MKFLGNKIIRISIVLTLLTIQISCSQFDSERFDRAMEELKTYQFGDSRTPLSDIESLVMQTTKENHTKMMASRLGELLDRDISFAAKQFICQQLRVIGNEDQLPVLTKLLKDAEFTDIAIFALETNPSPKVDEIFRNSLSQLEGEQKIAVINALGERRTGASVKALTPFISDTDERIAEATALALGKIGTVEAGQAIKKAMTEADKGRYKSLAGSYIMCANRLVTSGNLDAAIIIYREVADQNLDERLQIRAHHGLVKTGEEDGIQFVSQTIKSQDHVAKRLTYKSLIETSGEEATLEFCRLLSSVSTDGQILLLHALADRGDPAALPYIVDHLQNKNKAVRLSSIKALASLGDETVLPVIMQKVIGDDADESKEAQMALYKLRGTVVDDEILKLTRDPILQIRLEAIKALLVRNVVQATSNLLQLLEDPNESIRIESWNALAELGAEKEISPMIAAWIQSKNNKEINVAEEAVVKVFKKTRVKPLPTSEIVTAINTVDNKDLKISLIHSLGRIGDNETLPALKDFLKSGDHEIRAATIRALSWWPSDAVLPDLRAVVTSATDETDKIIALRGYIQLIGNESDRGNDETLKLYDDAMTLTWRSEEKKLILAGYSQIEEINALNTVESYLSDEDLKNEAAAAVIRICDELIEDTANEDDRNKMIGILKLISEKNHLETIREEASEILSRVEE